MLNFICRHVDSQDAPSAKCSRLVDVLFTRHDKEVVIRNSGAKRCEATAIAPPKGIVDRVADNMRGMTSQQAQYSGRNLVSIIDIYNVKTFTTQPFGQAVLKPGGK